MNQFFSGLMEGGIKGIASGVGQLAKDLRAAITGEEPLSSADKAAILERADAIEAAVQTMENQAAKGQQEVNIIDAKSGSLFKGGWRPFIGWTCGLGLFYSFVFRPVAWWVIQVAFIIRGSEVAIPPLPALDMKELVAMTMCMLGMGGYRMYERIRGKA